MPYLRYSFDKEALYLAATRLLTIHTNKGKSIAKTITDRTDYAENPDKTRKGELVTGYQCSSYTADVEFLLSKQQYADITGKDQGKHDVLAYHIRQSFKPGEITPELANKLGYELAMRFTRGRHAFIVATHIDRKHIHNHVIFNSTTLDCTKKFDDPYRSGRIIRRISDQICAENGLSIIEKPKLHSKGDYAHYGEWLESGEATLEKKPTHRVLLCTAIDRALEQKPADFNSLLKLLREAGYEVKPGKVTSLRGGGQKRFIRMDTLGEGYCEDELRAVIDGEKKHIPSKNIPAPTQPRKVNLLIDIQNSIKAQNSPGYAQWSKIFNLKTAASTLIFLQENGLDDMEKLRSAAQKAKDDFNGINTRIQGIDARLKDISALQKHIGTYSKTREVYAAYRKAGYSKKFLAANEDDITAHKAAKKYFDSLGLEKLPAISTLKTEYAALSAEKKKLYADYHPARKYMQDILAAQQNAMSLLNYRETAQAKENERV